MPSIRWANIWPHMERRGWTTPAELSHATGISKPAAARLLSGERHDLKRIEVPVLLALSKAFNVAPWRLLEYKKR